MAHAKVNMRASLNSEMSKKQPQKGDVRQSNNFNEKRHSVMGATTSSGFGVRQSSNGRNAVALASEKGNHVRYNSQLGSSR